jgi:hypothetical protein
MAAPLTPHVTPDRASERRSRQEALETVEVGAKSPWRAIVAGSAEGTVLLGP